MHVSVVHASGLSLRQWEAPGGWGPLRPRAQAPSLAALIFLPPHPKRNLCGIPAPGSLASSLLVQPILVPGVEPHSFSRLKLCRYPE